MIDKLSYRNIKRHSAEHELAPVTVFVGPNASGKTANLDALDWGLLGYVPRLRSPSAKGVTNEGMFRLSSGSYMAVELLFPGCEKIQRRLELKKDKLVASETVDVTCDPMLRDYALYFSLSPSARVKMVAKLVKTTAPGFSVPEILAAIKNIRLEENTESSEKAVLKVYNSLAELPPADPLDWTAAAIASVTESGKLAKATRQRMTAVNTGLAQLKSQDAEAQQQAGAVEGQLRKAKNDLGVAQRTCGEAKAVKDNAYKQEARRNVLLAVGKPQAERNETLTELGKVRGHLSQVASDESSLAVINEERRTVADELRGQLQAKNIQVETLKGSRKRLAAIMPPDYGDLPAQKKELEDKVFNLSLKSRGVTLVQQEEHVYRLREKRAVILSEFKSLSGRLDKLKAGRKESDKLDHCPTCLANHAGWKDAFLAKLDDEIIELTQEHEQLRDSGVAIRKELDEAEVSLVAMKAEDATLTSVTKTLNELNSKLSILSYGENVYREAVVELLTIDTAIGVASTDAAVLSSKLDAAVAKQGDSDTAILKLALLKNTLLKHEEALYEVIKQHDAWDAAQAELASLESVDFQQASAAHAAAQADVAAKQSLVDSFDEKYKSVVAQRAELKRQMEAVQAAEEAQSEVEVFKQAKKLLEDVQAALVALAFKGLLATVNLFTSSIMPHEVCYNAETMELGYYQDGHFVSAAVFSGAEELVTYIGLCVALAASTSQKIVVIDELSRLDTNNKRLLVTRLVELIDKQVIEQAVLADVDASAYKGLANVKEIVVT